MIHEPGKEIWVYGDLRNDRLFGFCLNVLAVAREISQLLAGKVAVALMGAASDGQSSVSTDETGIVSIDVATEKCIAHGADYVYVIDHDGFAVPSADLYARPFAEIIRECGPKLVLFTMTDFCRELAARVSRINNAGLIAECVNLRVDEGHIVARCPTWGGEIMADITYSGENETGFATVQHQAFKAVDVVGDPGEVKSIQVENLEESPGLKLISRVKEPEERRRLEDADVVVVGGAGLGNADDFGLVRDLALALGGEVGATRPPVLQHWVEEDRLIGQTGKNVKPRLLFSVGTSGAVQYTAGILESKTIVAINRDKNSPVFQLADIGIVADAKAFLPILTAKVKQAAMRDLTDLLQDAGKKETDTGFGSKVRRLRETHSWSLEALAQATGQSPEFIEKVEKEEATPPVSFLLRLASALEVNPSTFLSREEKTMMRNQRAREFMKRTQNYSYQTLSPAAETDHLRTFMITIEPGQAHKPVAYKHAGEEFIFVMEGDLQLTLGGKTHNLKPGESIHFNSDTPHKLKSTSHEMTRCLVVLYTP